MTSPADRTIAALRSTHDELASVVTDLSPDQLTGPSGASEWTVAQVLSHLGSGAEIGLATLQAAVAGGPGPGSDFNQLVWGRWDALHPHDQATGFITHDEALVAAFEALTPDQTASLQVDLGFLPAPLPLAAFAGMRLNETAQHSWDARVALDPAAAIVADTAALLAEHFATDLAFLTGFTGKADALASPAVVDLRGSGYGIVVADSASVAASPESSPLSSTATFDGPLEAAVRLLAGRLGPDHTPAGVEVTGNVTLDDLRRVFPGY